MNTKQSIIALCVFISMALSCADMPKSIKVQYDLFKSAPLRMATAYEAFNGACKKSTPPESFKKMQPVLATIAHDDSMQNIVHAYEIACAGSVADAVVAPDFEAAFLVMVLEKFVTMYYTQLDILESAYVYWNWAQKHSTLSVLSTFPTAWFSGDSNQETVQQNFLRTQQLRDAYNQQFGSVVRLLNAYYDQETDVVPWITEVHVFFKALCASSIGTSEGVVSSGVLCAQKLLEHEQQVIGTVNTVKMPSWFTRNWLALTAGTAAVGATAYWYFNNQQYAENHLNTATAFLKNGWNDYFYAPTQKLNMEIKKAFAAPSEVEDQKYTRTYTSFLNATKQGTVGVSEKPIAMVSTDTDMLTLCDSAMGQAFKELNGATHTVGFSFVQMPDYVDKRICALSKMLSALHLKSQVYSYRVEDLTEYCAQLKEQNKILWMIGWFMPAVIITSITSIGVAKLFNWFGKKDRYMLRLRLSQAEELLIRTEHEQLADDEYGRFLYLLMKEHEQVANNVLSGEQDPFLDDLRYLVQSRPSVMQKKETLQTMRLKHRSLAPSL